jgi:nitrogen fixation/metabolism regulation signal transduction histidine kinase
MPMLFDNFNVHCAIRILLLTITMGLMFYFFQSGFMVVGILTVILTACQIQALLRYVTRTNKELNRLLSSIKYSDFSQSFTDNIKGAGFEELTASLNEVIQNFQRTKLKNEAHLRFLQTVIDHAGVGLIAFQPDGTVELFNNAAKRLLKVPALMNIENLRPVAPQLVEIFGSLSPGENHLVRIQQNGGLLQVSIYATGFVSKQRQLLLVAMQDIQNELEEKEMKAWQNLIRVLTHEIMNSIAPIASLASTANGLLANDCRMEAENQNERLKDVCDAVETIEKRSTGLMAFIEKYRELTRIPQPRFQLVRVDKLVDRVKHLMDDQMMQHGIVFTTRIHPATLELTGDPALIEQVLINLCKNAVEAMDTVEKPQIDLRADTDAQGNPVIKVIDNGRGIPDEVLERIFIPFFTTKETGSGIGLSLSRQILRLHKGTLTAESTPGVKTVFTLRF